MHWCLLSGVLQACMEPVFFALIFITLETSMWPLTIPGVRQIVALIICIACSTCVNGRSIRFGERIQDKPESGVEIFRDGREALVDFRHILLFDVWSPYFWVGCVFTCFLY